MLINLHTVCILIVKTVFVKLFIKLLNNYIYFICKETSNWCPMDEIVNFKSLLLQDLIISNHANNHEAIANHRLAIVSQ